jgi:rhomboid protease GluP
MKINKEKAASIDNCITEDRASEWSLVLLAMDIPHEIVKYPFGWKIDVDDANRVPAQLQINLYEEENKNSGLSAEPAVNIDYFPIITPIIFILFYLYVHNTMHRIQWLEIGAASSKGILNGELWRCVTALTLHDDLAHLYSNIALGVLAAIALCSEIGKGIGWFSILLSGAMGNFFNAFIQNPENRSIGSSTSVFGAIGMLGVIHLLGKDKQRRKRSWIYFAGALGLLGYLGSSGERVDLGGHLFGFISGLFLGIINSALQRRIVLDNRIQTALIAISIFIVIVCWVKAFGVL